MFKDKALPLSIVFLGIAILIGSYQIASSLENPYYPPNVNGDTGKIASSINNLAREMSQSKEIDKEKEKNAMYLSETAEYLGLTFKEFNDLIEGGKIDIPYIKIDYKYVFYKEVVDEWLKTTGQMEFK